MNKTFILFWSPLFDSGPFGWSLLTAGVTHIAGPSNLVCPAACRYPTRPSSSCPLHQNVQ